MQVREGRRVQGQAADSHWRESDHRWPVLLVQRLPRRGASKNARGDSRVSEERVLDAALRDPAGPGDAGPAAGPPVCPAEVFAYDWPADEACSVSWCESRWQPDAISPDGQNLGIFQVNVVHRALVGGQEQRLLDAATNVRVAYELWRDYGWGIWACTP